MRSKHCQTPNLGISDAHSRCVSLIPCGDGELRAIIPVSCLAALPEDPSPPLFQSYHLGKAHYLLCVVLVTSKW